MAQAPEVGTGVDDYAEEEAEARHRAEAQQTTEQIVLGAMIHSQEALYGVQEVIRPDDFSQPRHEVIARAIVALASAGAPTDHISVCDQLERSGDVQRAGGMAYVMSLPFYVPAATGIYHAGLVSADAMRRRIRQAGQQIIQLAGQPGEPSVLQEQAQAAVQEAVETRAGKPRAFAEAYDRLLNRLESRQQRFRKTPWHELNSYIAGWQPGRLYVVGARPAAGKSVLALQAAVGLAQHGRVAFSSLEMDQDDLMTRLVASRAHVDLAKLERALLTDAEWERIAKARSWAVGLGLDVDDRASVTIHDVIAHARSVARRGPLAAVVVDYIGLVTTPQDRRGRWEHVGDISRGLKILAKKLHVPVIALAQLNRESVAGGKQRMPNLADLRESGSIEQDADVVLLLQRRVDEDARDTGLLDVVVGKNRQGRVGQFHLRFEGQYAQISSAQQGNPEPEPDTKVRLDIDG